MITRNADVYTQSQGQSATLLRSSEPPFQEVDRTPHFLSEFLVASARPFALEGKLLGCFCEVRFSLFCSWPLAAIVLSNTEVRLEIYGRFMGGSDRNRSNSGRLGQCVQHMQIAQIRINTGDFASR